MIDRTKYPELAKLDDLHTQKLTVADFLDWLSENKMFVGQYVVPEGHIYAKGLPITEGSEALIARYLGLDLNAIERERRAMLAAHVSGVGGTDGS